MSHKITIKTRSTEKYPSGEVHFSTFLKSFLRRSFEAKGFQELRLSRSKVDSPESVSPKLTSIRPTKYNMPMIVDSI